MVVLKRLADAVRDGDRVLAVVRGSAVNQDGRSNGLTAPNVLAQRDVITDALRRRGWRPTRRLRRGPRHRNGAGRSDRVRGAGSHLRPRVRRPLRVGGGEDESRSSGGGGRCRGFHQGGVGGQHGHIPPNLNFTGWNPAIDRRRRGSSLPEPTAVAGVGRPRRAGVSSFGIGGTNAHVVLEQAPEVVRRWPMGRAGGVRRWWCRARSAARVGSWAAVLADWMERPPAPRWRWPRWRTPSTITGPGTPSSPRSAPRPRAGGSRVTGGGRRAARGRGGAGRTTGRAGRARCSCIRVRVRSGPGWAASCWPMSRHSPRRSPSWSPISLPRPGSRCSDVLADGEPVTGIERIQPVLVGMQLALTALWRSYGVQPDAVIGHSMGEVSAAVVAGALTPAEGLRGDRHPVAVAGPAGRAGRDGAAGAGRRGHRGADRRLPRGHGGGVCLAAPDGDRRPARAGRRGDRGGDRRRTGWPAASTSTSPRITAIVDPILPAIARGTGRV